MPVPFKMLVTGGMESKRKTSDISVKCVLAEFEKYSIIVDAVQIHPKQLYACGGKELHV